MQTPEEIEQQRLADEEAVRLAALGDNSGGGGEGSAAGNEGDDDDDEKMFDDEDVIEGQGSSKFVSTLLPDSSKAPAGDSSAAGAPADVEAELTRLRSIEVLYNEMLANQAVSAALNWSKSGSGDILEFVNELTEGYRDFTKMTNEEIFEYDLRNTVAKKYNYSEDKIKRMIEEFSDEKEYTQISIINPLREKYESESKNKLAEVSKKFKSKADSHQTLSEEVQARELASWTELNEKITALVGKTYLKVPVTAEMAKEIIDGVATWSVRDANGVCDVDATIDAWWNFLFKEKTLKKHMSLGVSKAVEKGVLIRKTDGTKPNRMSNNSGGEGGGAKDKYLKSLEQTGGKLPRQGASQPN